MKSRMILPDFWTESFQKIKFENYSYRVIKFFYFE